MSELTEHPGLLFVVATLLPLASFVVLLLVGAKRAGLRPLRKDSALADSVYRLLGGDNPGRSAAYVALGAIVLAFVCSLTGFILYLHDSHVHHHQMESIQARLAIQKERLAHAGKDGKAAARWALTTVESDLEVEKELFARRWSGAITWAGIYPTAQNDPAQATVLKVGYYIDSLSAIMFVMVTFIASLIHLFSMGYMSDELQREVEDHEVHVGHGHLQRRGRFGRFFLFLSLFCFSMLNLVLADNLFQVFVSWELVGVCSFLLIGFYFERTSASNAANKAFITNRIGDAGFIIGLLILWTYVGSLNFQDIFQRLRAPQMDTHRAPLEFADQFVRVSPTQGAAADVQVVSLGEVQKAALVGKEDSGRFYYDEEGSHVVVFPREYGLRQTYKTYQVTDKTLKELRDRKTPDDVLKKLEGLKGALPMRDERFQNNLEELVPEIEKNSDLRRHILEASRSLTITARRGHFHAADYDPHYHMVTKESLAKMRRGGLAPDRVVPEVVVKGLAKLVGQGPWRDAAFRKKLKEQFPKVADKEPPAYLDTILEATVIPATILVTEHPGARDNSVMPYWMLVAAGLGIFLGCVGKSAQFPLQVWLPDAMEGPTPVSALIHAATMVAAGVYLVGRTYPLFTAEALLAIAYTGAITLFVAATIALVMTDIKKVLAYSTVSQLGYMMLGLGVGGWAAGLFHLVTHAFFKALLFLGSGSVIYGCHHQQDMLKMGGLFPKMKITALTMLVGCLAIAGIPLFSGWYSKDAVLAHALGFASLYNHHFLLFLLPLLTAGLTTFYMFRMWLMTFAGRPRDHHVHEHAHEPPWTLTLPLVVLAFFSVTVAWGWPLWNAEASWLEHQIKHAEPPSVVADLGGARHHHAGHDDHDHDHDDMEGMEHKHEHPEPAAVGAAHDDHEDHEHLGGVLGETHKLHSLAGNLALLLVVIGLSFAFAIYHFGVLDPREAKEQFPGVHRFLAHKWYFDEFYSAVLVRPALAVSNWARTFDGSVIDGFVHWLAKAGVVISWLHGLFDRYVIDGLANLLANVSYGVGAWLRGLQTGYLRSYVLFLVVAAISIWVVLTFVMGTPAGGAP